MANVRKNSPQLPAPSLPAMLVKCLCLSLHVCVCVGNGGTNGLFFSFAQLIYLASKNVWHWNTTHAGHSRVVCGPSEHHSVTGDSGGGDGGALWRESPLRTTTTAAAAGPPYLHIV